MAFLQRIRQTIISFFSQQRVKSDQLAPSTRDTTTSEQLEFSRSATGSQEHDSSGILSYASYQQRADDYAREMWPNSILLPDRKRKRGDQSYENLEYDYGEYNTGSLDEPCLPDDYEELYLRKRPRIADDIAIHGEGAAGQDPSELSSLDDESLSSDITSISLETSSEVLLDSDENHSESPEVNWRREYDDEDDDEGSTFDATGSYSLPVRFSSSALSNTPEISPVDKCDSVSFPSDDLVESEESGISEVQSSGDEDQPSHCGSDDTEEEFSDPDSEQEGRIETKEQDENEAKSKFDLEKAKRWAHAVKLPLGQWADAERDLYFRLAMRGFEPLIPSNWKSDFSTLPESLFSTHDAGDAIIMSKSDKDFRGTLSLLSSPIRCERKVGANQFQSHQVPQRSFLLRKTS